MDRVCIDCSALLNAGAAVKDERTRKTEGGVLLRLTTEWPHFYNPGAKSGNVLGKAFRALATSALSRSRRRVKPYAPSVEALPPPDPGAGVNYFSTYDEEASLWEGPRRIAEAIRRLDIEVRRAISEAYESGKDDGRDMLMQLASGNVSVNELNQAQIEAGRRRSRG